jgi:hypothetical protein
MKKKKKPREKDALKAGTSEAEGDPPPGKDLPPAPLWTKALPALMGLVFVLFGASGVVTGEVHVPKRGGSGGAVAFHGSPVAFVLTEALVFGVGALMIWGGMTGKFAPDMSKD